MSTGFKIPVEIPGAPERVTLGQLVSDGMALVRTSVEVFQRKAGIFEAEASQATWWRFWLTVGTGAVVGAVLFAIGRLFFEIRFPPMNILSPILTLIFAIPITMVSVYVGCYVSHWYATKRAGGQAPLVQHSQVMAMGWLPGHLADAIFSALTSIILGGSFSVFSFTAWAAGGFLALILIVVWIAIAFYTLMILVNGVRALYKFTDNNQVWITTILMLFTTGLAYAILDNLLPG